MTRKHYIQLAKRISEVDTFFEERHTVKQEMINIMCDVFRDENPRFNATKFREACGVEVYP